jgi:hypothetical protein
MPMLVRTSVRVGLVFSDIKSCDGSSQAQPGALLLAWTGAFMGAVTISLPATTVFPDAGSCVLAFWLACCDTGIGG